MKTPTWKVTATVAGWDVEVWVKPIELFVVIGAVWAILRLLGVIQ